MIDAADVLEALLELTEKLTSDVTLESALEAVTQTALRVLEADHASVRILDDERNQLLSGARAGKGMNVKPMKFNLTEGVSGWVVQHGALAVIGDVESDDRFQKRAGQGFQVGSMLAVPLWSAGHVVGVLSLSSEKKNAFAERDVVVARLLANCAAPSFQKARLERLSVTDPNIEAYNRRYLLPRLEQEMAKGRGGRSSLSVLLMDLDHFKNVNDLHGHAAGDTVLAEFAKRVQELTRTSDVLVRWGGEEFVLVMPRAKEDRAVEVADRIRKGVGGTPFVLENGTEIVQTVSVGVATWNGTESAPELTARADDAMYEAKRSGRDRVKRSTPPE